MHSGGAADRVAGEITARLLSDRSGRYEGKEVRFRCPEPNHPDKHPSARWNPEKHLWHCDACGAGGGWTDLAKSLGIELPRRSVGCTLADYASDKRLPEDLLRDISITDTKWCGTPAVRIPYLDEAGTERAARYRINLHKSPGEDNRFRWQKGTKPTLYGLWRLEQARSEDRVILCEGESDTHTLWCHGFPAVGVPGANNWKPAGDATFDGIDAVFVVIEPDQGGEAMMKKIAASSIRNRVRLLRIPSVNGRPCKDPSDLHLADADNFKSLLETAMAEAVPWCDAAHDGRPDENTPPFTLKKLSDVEPEPVEWLWPGFMPIGKLTNIVGDPGMGKSFLTCRIAASVSTGAPLPGDGQEARAPADVVILNAEDAPGDTIRPRIEAMGGDTERIHLLQTVGRSGEEREVTLSKDLGVIRQALSQTNANLVIIDPMQAYIGAGVDIYRTNEVRAVLAPLTRLADDCRVAVVAVMHLNKSGSTNVSNRVNASVDFTAAARSVLLVGADPNDAEVRVVLRAKSNLPGEPEPQGFRIADGKVEWTGSMPGVRALDLLRADSGASGPSSADRAAAWLIDQLADGPMPSSDLIRLAKEVGISRNALWKAKDDLGIKPRKCGMEGGWEWAMPEDSPPPPEESRTHEERYASKSTGRYPSGKRRIVPSSEKSTAWDSSKSPVSIDAGLFDETDEVFPVAGFEESEDLA